MKRNSLPLLDIDEIEKDIQKTARHWVAKWYAQHMMGLSKSQNIRHILIDVYHIGWLEEPNSVYSALKRLERTPFAPVYPVIKTDVPVTHDENTEEMCMKAYASSLEPVLTNILLTNDLPPQMNHQVALRQIGNMLEQIKVLDIFSSIPFAHKDCPTGQEVINKVNALQQRREKFKGTWMHMLHAGSFHSIPKSQIKQVFLDAQQEASWRDMWHVSPHDISLGMNHVCRMLEEIWAPPASSLPSFKLS